MLDPASLLLVVLALALMGSAWYFLRHTAAPIEQLHAWGGDQTRGDGVRTPLEVIGSRAGRMYTVGWQQVPGQDGVLLLGVDCAAPPGGAPVVDDGVLVVRIVRPDRGMFSAARLDALVDELCTLAEARERGETG